MASGINALANLLGKVNANGALVVTLDGGAGTATTMTVDTLKFDIANADVILVRDAANTPALRNGTNAQLFRLYDTFTDASNYERLNIGFSGGIAYVETAQAGTGSVQSLVVGTSGAADVVLQSTGTFFWRIRATTGHFVGTQPLAGLGYSTGAGGTVTQATSKSTGVTLNTVTGEITMNGAALAAATAVTFTLTSSAIALNDHILVSHASAGTLGAYTVTASQGAAGSCTITVRNNTAGSLSEAIVLKYSVFKSAVA